MGEQRTDAAAGASTLGALIDAGKLDEAARLQAESGDHAAASRAYEQACDFARAAEHALQAAERGRAMHLATLAGDEALLEHVRNAIESVGGTDEARRIASELESRGHDAEAARLWLVGGDPTAAAEAFDRVGLPLHAGRAYRAASKPADAARVLEAALRQSDGVAAVPSVSSADELAVELGGLYADHGRDEAAVRALQRVPPASDQRIPALRLLEGCLERLGYDQALHDVREEIARAAPDLVTSAATRPDDRPVGRAATDAPASDVAPLRLFRRYTVRREVVVTPHAQLLDAVDDVTGERVAVKVFAARLAGAGRDAWHRFAREAEVLRQLRHPNVVGLHDFVPAGPAIVMPWMAGGSLRDLLDREPLAPARAAEIATAILSALAEAHRRGIVHRDVKPSNVLFDEVGTARLADFGAAHLDAAGATVTAAQIGTAAYMAPEQLRGEPATARSDLYGVGMLLSEMLHGSVPTDGSRPSQWHPDLGAAHDALLARLVALAPEDRFPDAASALRAMQGLAWSDRRVARSRADAAPPEAAPPAPAAAGRIVLSQEPSGWPRARRGRDRWLERDVLVLEDDAATRATAAAFARADHAALPTVLRIDSSSRQIWVAPPNGVALEDRRVLLDEAQLAVLRGALAELAKVGGHHGAVDAAHVFVCDGAVSLAWPGRARSPRPPEPEGGQDDLAALARLAGTGRDR